mgnify:CR=1 FL=1
MARVIVDLLEVAVRTALHVAAQGCGATIAHLLCGSKNVHRPAVPGEIVLPVLPQDGLDGDGHGAIAPNARMVHKCIYPRKLVSRLAGAFSNAHRHDSAVGVHQRANIPA